MTAEAGIHPDGVVSHEALRIYTGILGQIGDIVMFTPTLRRLKELFPNSSITFAVSAKYREAGELVAGLPYVDRLFVTQLYFQKLTPPLFQPWERGWPVHLRGDDEVEEERKHDLVLETRPRHRREKWWEHADLGTELAHMVGVPGPIFPAPQIGIPGDFRLPPTLAALAGKVVFHNEPDIDPRKAWPWENARRFMELIGPRHMVLIGSGAGAASHREQSLPPEVTDLRGRTTLLESAALIANSLCFVGIESGPTCIAAALCAHTIGLFGTEYIPDPMAVQPLNLNATYMVAAGNLGLLPPEAVQHALMERVLSRPGVRVRPPDAPRGN